MSPLRRLADWKRPDPYLALLLLVAALVACDSTRRPEKQIVAQLYIQAVRGYQKYGRPVSTKIIRCRYRPTCSEYSIQAVERFGIGRGLALTLRRLSSCNQSVAPGTADPVPTS
jgi:putative membrane protein insertion efficiency factor